MESDGPGRDGTGRKYVTSVSLSATTRPICSKPHSAARQEQHPSILPFDAVISWHVTSRRCDRPMECRAGVIACAPCGAVADVCRSVCMLSKRCTMRVAGCASHLTPQSISPRPTAIASNVKHVASPILHVASCTLHIARVMLHVACCTLQIACCTLRLACCTAQHRASVQGRQASRL